MKNIPTYSQVTSISTFRNRINTATEVSYDMNTKELIFWACEAPVVICTFDPSVSGSTAQLNTYFVNYLRDKFPDKRRVIKFHSANKFEQIR